MSSQTVDAAQSSSQERMKRELSAFIQEISHARPVIFFFDDLQWADVSTVDLLAYLAGRFASMRVLVVVAYRQSEMLLVNHPFLSVKLDLQGRKVCREMPLEFLSREEVEGYLALAPDLLSVNGGTPPEEDKARELHTKTEREDMIAAALAAIPFMQKHAEATGKVGAVGFCFGGGVVNRMAAGSPDLAAAVPYYGLQVPAEMVPAIKAPLLLQYAETDENLNKGIAAYEAALTANNKKYAIYVYPGTQHAFNNDTGAARYNKAAADLAWSRTLAFFAEHLGAPPKAA